jgi:hypothetical protein
MAIRPGGKKVELLEQIIEDKLSGITIQIERLDESESVVRLFGDFRYGNRELLFREGRFVGGGVFVGECPKPTWISEVNDGI